MSQLQSHATLQLVESVSFFPTLDKLETFLSPSVSIKIRLEKWETNTLSTTECLTGWENRGILKKHRNFHTKSV